METGGLSEILMKLEFSWPEHTKPSNSGRDGRWASFCFSSTILLSQKKHRVIFIVSFLTPLWSLWVSSLPEMLWV
jgi:hypothetical protein